MRLSSINLADLDSVRPNEPLPFIEIESYSYSRSNGILSSGPAGLLGRWMMGAVLVLLCGFCRHPASDGGELQALFDAVAPVDEEAGTGKCTTVAFASFNQTVIQATSNVEWTHCDLSLGALTTASGPWDLRMRRFQAATNSGSSGSGSGGACRTGLSDLSAVNSVGQFSSSTAGNCPNFSVDVVQSAAGAGGGASDFSGSPIMLDWYNYDSVTHVLSARSEVYIVRSSDGLNHYAIQFYDYYSQAGTSGHPSIRWKGVAL